MKKLLLTSAALALSIGSAVAADLPSYKSAPPPPPPPPPPLWTGFYVGLNAGYTFGNSNSFNSVGFPIAGLGPIGIPQSIAAVNTFSLPINTDGFIGGGQIGYNWQFSPQFVAGIEADIQGVAGSSNRANGFVSAGVPGFPAESYPTVISASKSLDYLGTVRGRLGWLFTPTLLVYGTGGLAYGGVNVSHSLFGFNAPGGYTTGIFGAGAFSDTRVGWTAGGGVEWMFWPNWSAKVEYLYYDLGTVSYSGLVTQFNPPPVVWGSAATQASTRFDGHIVRAGVNYHFNWGAPAPVYAKY